MKLVAPNGKEVEVRNEFQAEVFIRAGFKPVEKSKKTKE